MSKIIEKVHDIILNDRLVNVREIFEDIGISHSTVITILHKKFAMNKPFARWVSRLLTVKNKFNRVTDSMSVLAVFRRNTSEFLRRTSLFPSGPG